MVFDFPQVETAVLREAFQKSLLRNDELHLEIKRLNDQIEALTLDLKLKDREWQD